MSKGSEPRALSAGLYLVSTPLGNARDITLRALDVLRAADVLAAEDTRTLRRLMEIHAVPVAGRRMIAYHDHSSPRDRGAVLAALRDGKTVAYASEAGTPLVADPGYQLVQDALEAEHDVIPVPGPSALIAAITVAGLPSDRFAFVGFPPAQKSARKKFFEALVSEKGTLVLYESPKRLGATLAVAGEVMGEDRAAVVCRELTKKFEETRRSTLGQLAAVYADTPPKGEIVLLIGAGDDTADPAQIEAALRKALETQKIKDAARDVADVYGVSRRDLYQLALSFDS
ncbi:16S rRNA (cytidine(1402)-2'-O)-methyltransferase [Rhodobacteraceae bacterium]|nr:16S rRNA (cytidine(1402)-2'-O)-methyltransferase [Paracoccaceae bacterium]